MKNNMHTGSNQDTSDKNCYHPSLKEGSNGEKICSSCGRVVYSGYSPDRKSESNSDQNNNSNNNGNQN